MKFGKAVLFVGTIEVDDLFFELNPEIQEHQQQWIREGKTTQVKIHFGQDVWRKYIISQD